MKALQTLAATVAILTLSGGINLVSAETVRHDHAMAHESTVQPARNKHEGIGVLEAVNAKAGKVQISHEAIASLNWPAMTMWFTLRTPLPKDLKTGDHVRFELEQNQNKWDISKIERR